MEASEYAELVEYLQTKKLPRRVQELAVSNQYKFRHKAEGYKLDNGKLVGVALEVPIIKKEDLTQTIDKAYSDCPLGPRKIYQKLGGTGIPRSAVENHIHSLESYQLHRPINRQRIVRTIRASEFGHRFEVDLVDMSSLAWKNNGYKWILTMVDIHSRHGWAIKLRNKNAEQVLEALGPLLREHKPKILQSDNGGEFSNKRLEALCHTLGIQQIFTSPYYPQTNGAVERFNGTLKRLIFRAFTMHQTERWIDLIDEIVRSYNMTKHSSTNDYPINGTSKINPPKFRVVGNVERLTLIPVGGKVRISNRTKSSWRKKTFQKSYVQNWSHEVHEVSKVDESKHLYRLKGLDGWYPRTDLLHIPDKVISDIGTRPARPSSGFNRERHLDRLHEERTGTAELPPTIVPEPITEPRRSGRSRRPNVRYQDYELG